MSLMSFDDGQRYQEMFDVVKLFVQNKKPTEIARELGLRRLDVINHIEEWRKSAVHSEMMKDRVDDLIGIMDEHFGILIQKAYEVIDEVDTPQDSRKETMTRSQMLSQKMNAIKTIADLESKRIDILQKSGLLDAADLGDELVEMEEKVAKLEQILSDELCEKCHPKILQRIAVEVHGDAPVVVVGDTVG